MFMVAACQHMRAASRPQRHTVSLLVRFSERCVHAAQRLAQRYESERHAALLPAHAGRKTTTYIIKLLRCRGVPNAREGPLRSHGRTVVAHKCCFHSCFFTCELPNDISALRLAPRCESGTHAALLLAHTSQCPKPLCLRENCCGVAAPLPKRRLQITDSPTLLATVRAHRFLVFFKTRPPKLSHRAFAIQIVDPKRIAVGEYGWKFGVGAE